MEVMLDIETLSTSPIATILTIGAIKFDRNDSIDASQMNTFYRRIIREENGFDVDPETVKWWEKQEKSARYEALENPDRIPLKQALQEFSTWMGSCQKVWANSPSFDCIIMTHAYRMYNLNEPWKFWNLRDCRTVMDIGGVSKFDLPTSGEHNALADCYRQIIGVKKALKNLAL